MKTKRKKRKKNLQKEVPVDKWLEKGLAAGDPIAKYGYHDKIDFHQGSAFREGADEVSELSDTID